jgi:plastocyanin
LEIANSNPFIDYDSDVKCSVTFLAEKPIHNPTLPIRMNQLENKVFKYDNNNVFTVGFNVKGRYGFPNVFI